MARQRILALIFAGMLLCVGTSGRSAEPQPQVPARLIPRGWEVIGETTGDLNRDGQADLVVELARKDETRILNERPDEQVPCRLLVVLREGSGYRQLASDDEVLSTAAQSSAANVGTDVEVKRGSLVLTQVGGGGNSKWMTVNRYRWDGRGLAQIGFTCEGYGLYGEVDHFHHKVFDINLLTSWIEETRFRWHTDQRLYDPGIPRKRRYRLVPIVGIPAFPTSRTAPLSPRVVKLAERADVLVGSDHWRGPADLSAVISAAILGERDQARLYVRALMHESAGGSIGEVRLLNAGGTLIRPERIERSPVPGGYIWQARYLPAALKLRYAKVVSNASDKIRVQGWGAPGLFEETLGDTFPASLEVISRSSSGGERLVLSTARSRKQPSLCWLTTPKLPRLGMTSELPFYYQPPDF